MTDQRRHALLMLVAVAALLAGLWAGVARIGWSLPPLRDSLPAAHGPLMVMGFLGTLISLERAASLRLTWTYLPPVLAAAGAVVLGVGGPVAVAKMLFLLAGFGLVAVFGRIVRMQPALHSGLMAAGALAWVGGGLLWLGGAPLFRVVPWWAAFLILTIVGERIELSRILRPDRSSRLWLMAGVVLYASGLLLSIARLAWGLQAMGVGMVVLAGWLLRYDLARYTVRSPGPGRFTAVGLLSGYAWLAIGGVLWLLLAGAPAGPRYDAMLHAVFLGFVFSMIFAHAPIILPGILQRPLPVAPRFYLHLGLLHLSLIARVAGDLAGSFEARRWGGLLGAVAVLLFMGNTATSFHRSWLRSYNPGI